MEPYSDCPLIPPLFLQQQSSRQSGGGGGGASLPVGLPDVGAAGRPLRRRRPPLRPRPRRRRTGAVGGDARAADTGMAFSALVNCGEERRSMHHS